MRCTTMKNLSVGPRETSVRTLLVLLPPPLLLLPLLLLLLQ